MGNAGGSIGKKGQFRSSFLRWGPVGGWVVGCVVVRFLVCCRGLS
jgi:hypothetical protein